MNEETTLPQHDPLADVPGAVDTKHEEEGEWFEHADPDSLDDPGPNQIEDLYSKLLDENGNGLRRVHVRSSYTKDFERVERQIHQRAAKLGKKKRDEFIARERRKAMGRKCIVAWEFTDKHGNEVPLTAQTAEAIMTEPKFRHHRNFIVIAIGKLTGDIEDAAEEDRGN